MPCMKCKNGKWKYGAKGRCQFDTKADCIKAAAAIHARQGKSALNDICLANFINELPPYINGNSFDFIIIDELQDS